MAVCEHKRQGSTLAVVPSLEAQDPTDRRASGRRRGVGYACGYRACRAAPAIGRTTAGAVNPSVGKLALMVSPTYDGIR